MGRASQRKGRAGELELAQLLQGYGYDVQPGQAVSYGATPDLVGLSGVHIECKRNERLNVPEAMAQAVRDADRFRDGAPAVFHRRNRSGWLVSRRRRPARLFPSSAIFSSFVSLKDNTAISALAKMAFSASMTNWIRSKNPMESSKIKTSLSNRTTL